MTRLAICSRDLHWQWINWALLYDIMEVSMLCLAWLHDPRTACVPARIELISRKIVSCEPGIKAIAVSRFREKLSPANWVQGVTTITQKMSRSWAPKKRGQTCDRDISNSAIYTTAIYREYTVSWFKMAKWPWRSRSITPVFNTCQEKLKMHIWCEFCDSSSNKFQVIVWTSQIS